MTQPPPKPWRVLDRLMDRFHMRPATLIMFLLCAGALSLLEWQSINTMRLPAVARATSIDHTSSVESTIAQVHVQPGQIVAPGDPLVTLSARNLRRELALLDAEILRQQRLMELEDLKAKQDNGKTSLTTTRITQDARRDLVKALAAEQEARSSLQALQNREQQLQQRTQAGLISKEVLETLQLQRAEQQATLRARQKTRQAEENRLKALTPGALTGEETMTASTRRYFEAEQKLLQERRTQLAEQLTALTVRATASGRVQQIHPLGSAVVEGSSVASILPTSAPEVVLWLPPQTHPAKVALGTSVELASGDHKCPSPGTIARVGASVEVSDPQASSDFLGRPHSGLPVYVTVPGDCSFGVGQLLQAELVLP